MGRVTYLLTRLLPGLSYLSRVHESMTKDRNPVPAVGPITSGSVSSVADTIFMERSKSRIQQWRVACRGSIETSEVSRVTWGSCCLLSLCHCKFMIADPLVQSLKKLMLGVEVYGSRPSMNIDVCNNRQVHLVMQVLRQFFADLVPLIILDNEGEPTRVKIVLTCSEDDKNLLLVRAESLYFSSLTSKTLNVSSCHAERNSEFRGGE
ncbi:hypothetical protein Taro_001446 [Colocasia esculenta]|uniref:Uncharacterized protein n=1 Tax=Colocasia esculenta TaxID=4460 RepID=A0A843TB31_COLES|nr:hypothetical protein [Colocasia esculenta]